MDIRVKICGLKTPEHVRAATKAGADYVGFVFFKKSPRNVSAALAAELCAEVPIGRCKVALVVNPSLEDLSDLLDVVPIDMIQLHGSETPDRVAQIKSEFGLPVMKAIGIRTNEDLDQIARYTGVADQLLIDAKPNPDADLPGGNGLAFDWGLLAGRRWATPWMLAGGLTPQNVQSAIQLTGARQLDVSSGVESAPGEKDVDLIKKFLDSAKQEK